MGAGRAYSSCRGTGLGVRLAGEAVDETLSPLGGGVVVDGSTSAMVFHFILFCCGLSCRQLEEIKS